MRLLVDACMSRKLFEAMRAAGHDAVWVRDWEPAAADSKIVVKAENEGRIIVTLDRDIPAIVLRSDERRPSVLRLTRLSTITQIPAALEALRLHEADLHDGALVTVSPRTIRVRRLVASR